MSFQPVSRCLPALLFALGLAAVAPAQTVVTWTLADSGNWSSGGNWSSTPDYPDDGQPLVGDTYAVQIGQGQVNVDVAVSVTSLTLTGGTLRAGNNTSLTVTGAFDWSGGNLDYNGSDPRIAIGAGAVSTWSGSMSWNNVEVTNAGSLTFADGVTLSLETEYDAMNGLHNLVGGTVTLANSGFWDGTWFGEGSAPVAFTNSGTVTKNGSGTFTFGSSSDYYPTMPFTNHGLVQVNAGVLALDGDAQGTGAWTVADGATLRFGGGNLAAGSSVSGAGDVVFDGSSTIEGVYAITGATRLNGSARFETAGPTSFSTLIIGGGFAGIYGAAALTVSGSLEWAGTIGGDVVTQTFALEAGATGTITANANAKLSRRTFNNSGSLTWLGAATQAGSVFGFDSAAVFNNLAGGTFTAAGNGNGGTQGQASSTGGTFNNAGEFVKTGAGTTTRLNWSFANNGVVSADAGRLEIATLTTPGGVYEVASGASLLLRRNSSFDVFTFDFTGSYDVAVGGGLEFARGDLRAAATFASGTGTVTFAESMLVSRDSVPASLLRFTGATGILPPSGTFTAAHVELVEGGGLSPSGAASRVRITDTLTWSGGFVAGGGPFPSAAGGTVELAAGSSTVLSGTGTVGSGTLQIDGGFQFQSGSQLRVGANAVVRPGATLTVGEGASIFLAPSTSAAQDATLRGGAVNTTGTGVLRVGTTRSVVVGSSYGTLDSVAFSGTAELTQNLSALRLINGATVNGRVRFTAVAPTRYTAFELHQDGALADVVFEDTTPLGNAKAVVALIGNRTVTFGPTVELSRVQNVLGDYFNESTGQIIETGAAHLVNEGRIATDGAGRFTTLAALASFENRGVLEVTDGAQMVSDFSFTQTAGRITVGVGSTFTMSNPSYRASTRTLTLAGGVLEGAGTFSGNLAVGDAVLAPAFGSALDAVGELTLGLVSAGGFTAADTTRWQFDLGGLVAGDSYDSIVFSGAPEIELGGVLELSFTNGFASVITGTDTFFLLTGSTFSGSFFNVEPGEWLSTTDGFGSFQVNYGSGSAFGADAVVLSAYTAAVPEPSTWAVLLGGAALAGAIWRRRVTAASARAVDRP